MTLRLEKITPDNVDAALQLRVRPDQQKNVASVTKSLAEAYAWGETAWPRPGSRKRTGPGGFYLKLGFRTTGETSGGQTVGVLDLPDAPHPS